MKKSTFQFLTMLIIAFAFQAFISTLWAQTPQKMSYQAVIRNSSDQLVANKIVGMKISILKGSESGTAVYTETQKPTTNANGLVSIEIGVGSGFDAIDWATGPYFIKTETDPSGGTNYTISGISQLLSVPYALHARTVEIDQVDDADADPTSEIQTLSKTENTVTLSKNGGSFTDAVDDADADPSNEIQTLSLSGTNLTLSKNGGTVTLPSSGGGDNWGTQTAVTNATLAGNGSTASPLKIAQQGATAGQTLKWNGTSWAPGNEAKEDSVNEIQTLSLSGTSLTLSKNGGTVTLPSSGGGDNWGTQTAVTNATLEGNGSTASPLKIAQQGATAGQTLKWDGTVWAPGDDAKGAGLTLPYSESVSYSDYVFSIANSLGSAISGESSSPYGTGVFGGNSSQTGYPYGVAGYTCSPNGISVYADNTSSGIGVFGSSVSGTGVFGSSISGTGVSGRATQESGTTYGVNGSVSSPDGVGVYGHNNANSGYAIGVKGESSYGTGVYGTGECGVHGSSNSGVGVIGSTKADYASGVFGAGTGKGSSSGVYGDAGESFSPPMPGNVGVLGQANEHIGVAGTAVSGVGGYFSSLSGLALKTTGGIQLTGVGEAAGKVLTSDDKGNATWQTGSSKLELPYSQNTSTDGDAFWINNDEYSAIRGTSMATSGSASGVSGETKSDEGYGVLALNLATSGRGIAVRANSISPNGYGVYGSGGSAGVCGWSTNDGVGVYGINGSYSGSTIGVEGESLSLEGIGVYGKAEGHGVYGSSINGKGVYGESINSSGVVGKTMANNCSGVSGYGTGGDYSSGVMGDTGESDTKTLLPGNMGDLGQANEHIGIAGIAISGIGVYGNSDSGDAGYFDGRLVVNGNVGVNTTTPNAAYELDVNGETNTGAININCDGKAITCNGNEAVWYNGDHFSWGYGCVWNAIDKKVFIGSGSTDPGANMLVVNGAAAKPGGGSWATWSDIRLKDIQGNYEKGLKEIVSLRPVKFNYKAGNACNLPSDKNYVGFIAQDVQKVFPEAVAEGKDGYLSLDVNEINVALVNAVKELKAENDKLKVENEQIISRLTNLEKIISASAMK